MATIGQNLKRLRKARGLGQVELGNKSGVPQQTISQIERDRREPHPSTLRKLADAMGVHMGEFFAEEEPPDGRILRRILANCELLEAYMQDPPDEDTWDRALTEFYELAGQHLEVAIRIAERTKVSGRELERADRELLAQVREAEMARTALYGRVGEFNLKQYGHLHKDAG